MAPRDLTSLTNTELRSFLNSFDTVLSDCDGVLWNFGKPIPGVPQTIQKLKQCGKRISFVSNNNLTGTAGLHKSLALLDTELGIENVTIPSQAIIAFLKSLNFEKHVFLVGSESMKKEFVEAGLKVFKEEINTKANLLELFNQMRQNEDVGAVVLDYDIFLNYSSLVRASLILNEQNVIFICGASDSKIFAGNNVVIPGPKAFLNAILDVVDQKPLMFGKPSLNYTKFIDQKYNIKDPSRVLFVGDSISQDIEFGSISGYQTLLVLTGINSLVDLETCEDTVQIPKYYIDSFGSLSELIQTRLGV